MGSQALCVKHYVATQTLEEDDNKKFSGNMNSNISYWKFNELHVIDEGAAMKPRLLSRAVQWHNVHILDPVQLVQRQGKQGDRVIDKSSVRVQVEHISVCKLELVALVHLALHNVPDDCLHLMAVGVHQPQGCEVGSTVLEVFHVNSVSVETAQDVEIL